MTTEPSAIEQLLVGSLLVLAGSGILIRRKAIEADLVGSASLLKAFGRVRIRPKVVVNVPGFVLMTSGLVGLGRGVFRLLAGG